MNSPNSNRPNDSQTDPNSSSIQRQWKWWLMVILNIIFVLAGQSAGTLLGRFYYNKGGNSKWIQTLTISAAFPILYIPLLLLPPHNSPSNPPPIKKITLIYIFLGLIASADSLMYSYGLLYLPVSTYSLVCATQLAFNAVFSYVINSERFTHLTLNSVVLITFSAAILAFHSDPGGGPNEASKGKFALGFVLTITASATYSLILSLIELTFKKVLKSQTFSVVLDMQIYTSMVATIAGVVGLFGSGEWRELKGEMEGFGKGRVSYVMILVWTAISWQVASVGVVGLVFEVSSLFSNVISTVGIPLAPMLAVIFLNERMDGIKVVSLLLAVWGFVSYFYQHYIEYKSEERAEMSREEKLSSCLDA